MNAEINDTNDVEYVMPYEHVYLYVCDNDNVFYFLDFHEKVYIYDVHAF